MKVFNQFILLVVFQLLVCPYVLGDIDGRKTNNEDDVKCACGYECSSNSDKFKTGLLLPVDWKPTPLSKNILENLLSELKHSQAYSPLLNAKPLGLDLDPLMNQVSNLTKDELYEKIVELYNQFIPLEFDWRHHDGVTNVKNQSRCGSCWAFATTAAIESMLLLQKRLNISLSDQQLVDCSCAYGPKCCDGGFPKDAFDYIRDNGIMSNDDYPYVSHNDSCKYRADKIVTHVSDTIPLPSDDEMLLLHALLIRPIIVLIHASDNFGKIEKGKVFYDEEYIGGSSPLNHAVLLVGYGTDPTEGDYWIVKNSWGKDWHDEGYIKIARNRGNNCGLASAALLPVL